MSLSIWFRIIRIKFLLASVIAVSIGIAVSYWQNPNLDIIHAALTMGGVIALHVSVDLLNDYWDYKRGIDTITRRTMFSGGTGVLPEGLLKPSLVYKVGIAFLLLGSLVGTYFVIEYGWIIAIILGFAVMSIYFYSTKIVNSGLGELFVGIKGTMIVLGTVFIQTQQIELINIVSGLIAGITSAFVLFITSIPDFDADKQKGRRTLVIIIGKSRVTNVFWLFPTVCYGVIVIGVIMGILPIFCLIAFGTIPLVISSGKKIKKNVEVTNEFVSIMKSVVLFSRLTGILFLIGFLLDMLK